MAKPSEKVKKWNYSIAKIAVLNVAYCATNIVMYSNNHAALNHTS